MVEKMPDIFLVNIIKNNMNPEVTIIANAFDFEGRSHYVQTLFFKLRPKIESVSDDALIKIGTFGVAIYFLLGMESIVM